MSKDMSGLSTGAIVGIAFAVIIICAVLNRVLAFDPWKRKSSKHAQSTIDHTHSSHDAPRSSVQGTNYLKDVVGASDRDIHMQPKYVNKDYSKRVANTRETREDTQSTSADYPSRDVATKGIPGPHDIPDTIQEYEKYRKSRKGKYVWICNFGDSKDDVVRSLEASDVSELFSCNGLNKLAFNYQPYMMWNENRDHTCKGVIERELRKKDDTDLFICMISSYGNATDICNGKKEESIRILASLDNTNIYTKLRDRPKILIFDLYQPNVYHKKKNPSSLFTVHKDWLLVFVRNITHAQFINRLKHEIANMHDKLDFVSILERVNGCNMDMNIIHRMPQKFFVNDTLESMKTEDMSHFNIKGVVRCCFFGSTKFDKSIDLPGIREDKANVLAMSEEFHYSVYNLLSATQTKLDFKKELEQEGGCHFFVFSSHGSSDGISTKNNETVPFDYFISEIANRTLTEVPVILVFDCCRTGKGKGVEGKTFKDTEVERPEDEGFTYHVNVAKKGLKMNNVIVVYAAVDGYMSTMDNDKGSHFITTMCDIIKKHRLNLDFLSMMECANTEICRSKCRQQTCVEIDSQLTKKLFLFEMEHPVPDKVPGSACYKPEDKNPCLQQVLDKKSKTLPYNIHLQ